MNERFVLIAVARAREQWCSELARWSTSGAAPLELLKCLSTEEARALLGTGRRASALVLDARSTKVDRDLVEFAAEAGVTTLVVSDGSIHHDWESLGCAAVLDHRLELGPLMEVLSRHCRVVERHDRRPGRVDLHDDAPRKGRLMAVLGTGGSGASTVAMAAADGLGRDTPAEPVAGTSVVLVDGARRADLAMYHDVGDVIPGLPELVEAHRTDRLDPSEVRRLARPTSAGHDLILGIRRPRDWVALRRRAVAAALDSLRRTYELVVIDVDCDLDGESQTGSADVADRHSISLCALDAADLVLVVGRPGLKGVHDLVRLVDDVVGCGVPSRRVLPVVTSAPRTAPGRAAVTRAVAELADPGSGPTAPVLHLPRPRGLEDRVHRSGRVPDQLGRPVGRLVTSLLATLDPRESEGVTAGTRVRPGEMAADLDLAGSDVA